MNALKHGILSKEVLVEALHYRESSGEWEALRHRFWEDLQPVGALEEMLVDQIMTAYWRLRRALVAESGEITLSVDKGYWKGGQGTDVMMVWACWWAAPDMEEAMQRNWQGNSILLGWLEDTRRAVEREGLLTAVIVGELARHFSDKPSSLVVEFENLLGRQGLEAGETGSTALRKTQKSEALALVDERMETIRDRRERCMDHEDSIEDGRQAAAVLPSAEVLDKILRYETKLERQMDRAMAQLERRQRMRRGEALPAPLSVEISDRS